MVVPGAILVVGSVTDDRHIWLRHAEGLAVQHGVRESLRRADVTLEAIKLSDDIVVQEALWSDANLHGSSVRMRAPIFAVSGLRQGRRKENLLGLNYLSRYVATFDFPNRTLYLKKGRRFAEGDLQDKSGLHIVRLRGNPVVESVDKGSPAALVGMRPADEIVRISDQDAQRLSLFSIRRLLCQPREDVRLAVRRGDQQIVLPLLLSK